MWCPGRPMCATPEAACSSSPYAVGESKSAKRTIGGEYGKRLDCGTQGATSGANSTLEAMAAINRLQNSGRKGDGIAQCLEGRNAPYTARTGAAT
jgi:hypothetical protein